MTPHPDLLAAFDAAMACGDVEAALSSPPIAMPEPIPAEPPLPDDPAALLSPETRQLRRQAERTATRALANAERDLEAKQQFSNAMLMARATDDQGVSRLYRDLFTGPNRHDRRRSAST